MLINPYTPGAGMLPEYLAGRDKIIDEAKASIDSLILGYPRRPIIYYGLRGVGKTVLLTYLKNYADSKQVITFSFEIKEKDSFIKDLIAYTNQVIISLSKIEQIKHLFDSVKQSLMNLSLTYSVGEESISIEKKISMGTFEHNFVDLMINLGKLAREAKRTIVIFLDEIQYAKQDELEALITAQHKINQEKLPITIIGAGLPRVLVTMSESKTYAERMFLFQPIDSLKYEDAVKAIVNPGKAFNIKYTEEALEEIYNITGGYPFFIQLFCYLISEKFQDITLDIVKENKKVFLEELDKSFFKVRFNKCTKKEQEFMFAMSDCDKLPCTMANVANILGKPLKNISPVRGSLIRKNIIYPTRYGEIDFTVPQFKEFLQRIK